MSSDRSATVLERATVRAREGSVNPVTLLWTLAASEIYLLNTGPAVSGELPSDPFVLSTDAATFLAVFSHRDMAAPFFEEGTHTLVDVSGLHLLSRLPDGVGIIVNPNSKRGFEVPADGVATFVSELLASPRNERDGKQ